MHMTHGTRIPPLPEDEWDDETTHLIRLPWFSDRPTNGQNFTKTMVRHRELFRVWNEFGRTLFNGRLPTRDRELLILRTAWLTRSTFEWAYHQPLVEQLGMTPDEIDRIADGPDAAGWGELDAALLRAADELHVGADITDATWAVLRVHYDELELIEIPVVVGQYHLVAYFTNTMGSEPDPLLPRLPEPR
jgi:alkylhydroperoxidase family enzyme